MINRPDVYSLPGFADPIASWLHLLGAAVFLALTPYLVRRAWKSRGRAVALLVFAFAVVLQLALSGVYHMLPLQGVARSVMQRLDHAAIFLLIVATFTPAYIILFRGTERWATLLFMWSAAITGIVLKTVFFRQIPEMLGLALYLGLGWVGLIAMVRLAVRYGLRFELFLLLGNLAYTVSAILDFHQVPTIVKGVLGPHETFHLGVLMGISFHWIFFHQIANWKSRQSSSRIEPLKRSQEKLAVSST